jgi:hypothetical protein
VTGLSWVTQADRARWQQQAAGELAAILVACAGLPCIAWTVGPAGAVLAGQVNGLAPPGRVRETFSAWRTALALAEYHERQLSGGATWLHAAARRHHVTIRLTATVFDGEEDDQ